MKWLQIMWIVYNGCGPKFYVQSASEVCLHQVVNKAGNIKLSTRPSYFVLAQVTTISSKTKFGPMLKVMQLFSETQKL